MRSSFVKAVVAGSMLAGLSALPALAAVQARGRAEGRDDHLRAEERRRLVAGLRRGPPAHGEVDGDHDPLRRERAGERDRHPAAGRAVHRARATTSSSARAFGYSDTFKELAEKYPNVAFLNGAGTTNGPNLESFYGRTYETPVSLRHGRRRRVEDRQARLRRRQSVRPRELDGQRLRSSARSRSTRTPPSR